MASRAAVAVILLHGRGESTADIIAVSQRLPVDMPVHFRALAAPGGSWYPERFIAPLADNEPALSSALQAIEREVEQLELEGWERERIVLMGFSQGACLACEYVHRHPARWGGLVAFTGGLIGPPGSAWLPRTALEGMKVLLTNGDDDPWVPWWRVEETAAAFRASGSEVELKQIPGRAHLVSDEEAAAAASLLVAAACASEGAVALRPVADNLTND